jgi:hypothetical protein
MKHVKRALNFSWKAIIAGLMSASCSSLAHSEEVCEPKLAFPSVIQTPRYDPFDPSPLIIEGEFSLFAPNCEGVTPPPSIFVSAGWGSQAPLIKQSDQGLSFIFTIAGRDFTSASSNTATGVQETGVAVSLPSVSTGTKVGTWRLIIPAHQIVAPGSYRLNVEANSQTGEGLLTASTPNAGLKASPIRIQTEVASVMNIGVTGCDVTAENSAGSRIRSSLLDLAGSCKLRLGNDGAGMVNGDRARARLTTQSNVRVRLSMTSLNSGALVLDGNANDDRSTRRVNYSASLKGSGEAFNFVCSGTSCGTSQIIVPGDGPLGTDLLFELEVSDPTILQKRAGLYGDVITLTIQPAS